jgi:subtilisin family serine protease
MTSPNDRMHIQGYWQRVKGQKSFVEGEKPTEDTFGHGTAVATLLLKVCPNADIYIAKVTKSVLGTHLPDKDAVQKALDYAVDPEKWNVDIINMSFGWDIDDHRGVRMALQKARESALLFASTSNFGIGRPIDIMFPARFPDVIAIDAADGLGSPAPFNPTSDLDLGKNRFSALGIDVRGYYPPKNKEVRLEGTSFACPVAVGCAALVLEFARQPPLCHATDVSEFLKTHFDMLLILDMISTTKQNYRFICPWELLKGSTKDPYGDNIKGGSPRYDAAYRIIQLLKKYHGEDVGNKMFE